MSISIVTFLSDTTAEVEIKEPIDGFPNTFYVTKKIQLEPNTPISFEMDVEDFAYLNVESQQMKVKYSLLILEGFHLTIKYLNGKTTLSGDNSKGIDYLYENYTKKGLGYYVNQMGSLVVTIIADSINFNKLDKTISTWNENLKYKKDLLNMLNQNEISNNAYDILTKTLEHAYLGIESMLYRGIINGMLKGYKPTEQERYKLFERIEKLFNNERYLNEKTPKYLYAFPNDYYELKYKFLSDGIKERMDKKYNKPIFGSYITWIFAPDYMQLKQLGTQAIFDIQNGVGQLNSEEFVQWFQNKFPDKEYTHIISKLYSKQKESLNYNHSEAVFLDDKSINTFNDLAELPEVKGKYIYVDLWASWCSPCLAQFKYNKQLHDLLSTYKDVVIVYISIDEEKETETWKRQIKLHNLNGFHIRANKPLYEYISANVYNGKSVSVPRYLILKKNGEILMSDLPRPSEFNKLKDALDKAL